ncbi:patatin-like phospholipase family protein [Amycolatopsis sp. Poz14]|uniref:patatin-like phospholipase family protein n=1 Tax=Amycolatopsis sp. Poz14 TaxID=1447705 RepID=UPI001EE889D3|nr:patatin-like phospholipase family protein [Amycolatopsis sp. Poz14]MCG3749823.1 patatin-like phospholipase family protein [Amycolatopsis sp. Poz14]
MSRALVLGGGGVAGIAWATGLLTGLAEAGQDVTDVDMLIGTSAGAAVAAQLGSGLPLPQLYARQTDPALQAAEIAAEFDPEKFGEEFAAVLADGGTAAETRRAMGKYALAAETVPEPRRRAVIESRLPSHEWPERAVKIVAVEAETGEPAVFDSSSGVSLIAAVAASCAVPGIWPAVPINGGWYVDGGVRSASNADYATGFAQVAVVVPMGAAEPFPTERPFDQVLADLRSAGAKVAVLEPDEASVAAIGPNPLDPATRSTAAAAGLAQGRRGGVVWE